MRKKQVLQLLTMLTATTAVCAVLFLRHQPMEVAAVRVEKGNICRTVGVAGTVCYTQETPVTAMVSGMVDSTICMIKNFLNKHSICLINSI